jgi:Uma2 family endonuclease
MNLSLTELPLPVHLRPETAMTEDELLRFCAVNDSVRIEREPNGELLIMSPSGSETSNINIRLSRLLDEWAEADCRGLAFDANGGFTLPDNSMRAPDGAWVELSRWNSLSKHQQQRFAPLCPDFIVELRSPTDTLPALKRKMQQWIDNGTKLAWLIDPIDRAVSIYRPHQEVEFHQNPSSIHADGIMSGFSLVLSRLWGS